MIVAARQVALEHGDVKVTTGVIKPQTSSINVIPEDVTFSLDVRAADDATQDATVAAIREQYAAIAGGEGVDVSVDEQWRVPPTPFDPGIRDLAEQLCLERGYAWRRLLGGIGHDSQKSGTGDARSHVVHSNRGRPEPLSNRSLNLAGDCAGNRRVTRTDPLAGQQLNRRVDDGRSVIFRLNGVTR
jgi:hypothetical protein